MCGLRKRHNEVSQIFNVNEMGPRRTPLQRFNVLQGAELNELEASSTDWLTPCTVRTSNRHTTASPKATVSAVALGPVKLVYAQTVGAEIAVAYAQRESNYVVNFALDGVNRVSVGEDREICSPERAAILSPQMVAGMHLSDGYSQLHVRIERFALERHLERMLGTAVVKPIRFQMGMDLSHPALASWARGLRGLIDDLDEPSGLSGIRAETHPWSDFLMTGLLLAQPHNYADQLIKGQSSGFRPRSLTRAVELIEREPESDLSLSRLASVAGVGPRALQRYFREHLGTSPREYVEYVRLSRAHDDLVAGIGTSVAEIAFRWGFTHIPRFAGAYHARYGMLPSEALRRAGHLVHDQAV